MATPAWAAMSFIVVRRVPRTPTARRAPSSSPARVLAIALPARDRVPPERRGGADATVVGTVERIRWSSGSRERSGTPT